MKANVHLWVQFNDVPSDHCALLHQVQPRPDRTAVCCFHLLDSFPHQRHPGVKSRIMQFGKQLRAEGERSPNRFYRGSADPFSLHVQVLLFRPLLKALMICLNYFGRIVIGLLCMNKVVKIKWSGQI